MHIVMMYFLFNRVGNLSNCLEHLSHFNMFTLDVIVNHSFLYPVNLMTSFRTYQTWKNITVFVYVIPSWFEHCTISTILRRSTYSMKKIKPMNELTFFCWVIYSRGLTPLKKVLGFRLCWSSRTIRLRLTLL